MPGIGNTPLAGLQVDDVTAHIQQALKLIDACTGVRHYHLDVRAEPPRVTWCIRPLRDDAADGVRAEGEHALDARVVDDNTIVECTATLRSPLPHAESGLPFAPREVTVRSVGLLYDFLFLHLCVGIRCLRTLNDFLDTAGGPWLHLAPARDPEDGGTVFMLHNKVVPSLSLKVREQADLALVLSHAPPPANQHHTGAQFGGKASVIPLVPPAQASASAKKKARTGAPLPPQQEAYADADPAMYLEHCGLVPPSTPDLRPAPHPITHAMISVLTEHALCAPVAAPQ